MSQGERRLAAIMFTDMVGYTALGQRDESLSLALVDEHRKVVRPILGRHKGREVKTMGDAFLVEFPSAVDAVRCGYDIQRAIREFNFTLAPEKRIRLRVGIHVGEVVDADGDISGDAVNVASRIEPIAEDGGVCVTRQVYDHVRGKVDIPLSSLGPKSLKNVTDPVEVYKMVMPWGGESPPSQPDKNRVAVLPFANMSPDPADEYFADGMTEELIDRLAQVKLLKVIARTSVMSYKGEKKKASQIARELGVGTLVEGSVRKAANRVRVTVQLISAANEEHLWSSHYDGNLEDIFAVQSEIAEKVAAELRIQLLDSEKQVLEREATASTEAYTFFLRGRELFRRRGEGPLREAIALFERAVELDPSFARAHVGLAGCHMALANIGYEPWESSIARAKPPLKRALELDPGLAEAHAAQAGLLFAEDDMQGAEAEARKAIELNPSLPEAYDILSNVQALKGDADEAVRLTETCYRLDPITPKYIHDLGVAYFYTGREEEALEHWKRTAGIAPATSYKVMAEYRLWKGDIEEARRLHKAVSEMDPNHAWVKWMRGYMAAVTGDREAALLEIRRIKESDSGALAFNQVAYICYALGDVDSYFSNIRIAMERHALDVGYVMYCPLFAKARADPRYHVLMDDLRKMTGLSSAQG